MGVHIIFNELTHKWEIHGCMFVWAYDTEAEAKANYSKAWDYHNKKLNAWSFTCNWLASYR